MLNNFRFLFKYLRQKSPQALRRRIDARRSVSQLYSKRQSNFNQIAVAILVTGVVGDSIMAARYLRDLKAAYPDLIFDVFSANLKQSKWIFESVIGVRSHFQDSLFDAMAVDYKITLVFSDTIAFRSVKNGYVDFPKPIWNLIEKLRSHSESWTVNQANRHIRESTLSLELFFKHNQTRASASHFISGINYAGPRFPLTVEGDYVERYKLADQKYITVHNGFSIAEVAVNKSSTKSYMRFSEVIDQFRKVRSEIMFVQIGASTSSTINNVDINLIGKTNLPQAAALIKNAICHLDNESGFVSVASCFGTRCCVIYGPTHPEYFSYSGNIAVRPVECGCCWWLAKNWMTRCPRGMTEPVCMHSQPPSVVAQSLLQLLDSIDNDSVRN